MFGDSNNALKSEWSDQETHRKIYFVTEKEYAEYEIFSIYKTEVEDYYITTNFATETEFENFKTEITNRSFKKLEPISRNENSEIKNQILTLSTCGRDNHFRIVIHAKKVYNIYYD